MTDQDRIKKLEQNVEMLLVMHADRYGEPMTQAESDYALEIKKRVGWRGYHIIDKKLGMEEASAKHRELKLQLSMLEHDWPDLKGEK